MPDKNPEKRIRGWKDVRKKSKNKAGDYGIFYLDGGDHVSGSGGICI